MGRLAGSWGLAMVTAKRRIAQGGLKGAIERGRQARRAWISDRVVLSSAEFAAARGVASEALVALQAGDQLFSLTIEGEVWWPAELLKLSAADASALCSALDGADESSKLVFVMRTHGALGGRTVTEAVANGQLADVLRLARTWAERH